MNFFKEIFDYRQMIFSLVHKDLRGRYLGTLLGFLWTFVNPLLQLLVYNLIFSVVFRNGIERFYLFLFIGLVPWMFFSSCVVGGSTSVISASSMVTKIYFPREVLPIAYVTSSFVNMLLCFIVVFLIVFISGISFNIAVWIYLPLVMIIEYVMGLGVAMIVSSLTVYFRDLEHILGILTMAWMYLTPILYTFDTVPEGIRRILSLNPMKPVIEAYQSILYYAKAPELDTMIQAVFFGVVMVFIGFIIFNLLKRKFAEEL
ncbi:MAG: ABC transporter permease [Clostridiales bacterium]|nr:ABC transporter permease [Clostridiales bacterium]